jgi:hypothetical protein
MSRQSKRHSPANRKEAWKRNLAKGAPFRYKPGQSGNPSGRPKFRELSVACREILSRQVPGEHCTYAEKIVWRLIKLALKGNISAISEIFDRTEGRAPLALTIAEQNDPLNDLINEMKKKHEQIGKPETHEDDEVIQ